MPPQVTPTENITTMPKPPKSGAGPTVGIVIIIILFIIGGLYFWGARLNQQDNNPLPLIPGDATSTL
jgi:hypothetical protein